MTGKQCLHVLNPPNKFFFKSKAGLREVYSYKFQHQKITKNLMITWRQENPPKRDDKSQQRSEVEMTTQEDQRNKELAIEKDEQDS